MFRLDTLAVDIIHRSSKTGGALEYIFAMFALNFNKETVPFLYSLALLLMPYSIRNMLFCALLPPSGLLITYLLKRLISRPRPTLYPPRFEALIFDFRGQEKNHSMPSGDSIQAVTFWLLLWDYGFVSWWASAIFGGLTMMARVYYMCHYPSDTIVGASVGITNFYMLKALIGVT